MNKELSNERIYAFSPSANVTIHVLVPKLFTHEYFEECVSKLVRDIPHLNSVYDIDEERKPYLREVGFMMPQILYVQRKSRKTYRKTIQEEERIPFVRRNNPLYRIVVLEDENYTEILWISHRMLFDEESAKRVCASFVRLLQQETTAELEMTNNAEVNESLGRYWNLKKKFVLHWFEKHYHEVKEMQYRDMFMHYYANHRTKVEEVTFTKEQTRALQAFCENYQLPLEAIILACFLCAQQKYENKDTKAFHMVDYQDTSKSKSERELGYFKEMVTVELSYVARKSLVENAQHLYKVISKKKQERELHFSALIHNLPIDLLADMYAEGGNEESNLAISMLKKEIYDGKRRHGLAYLPLHDLDCEGAEIFTVLPSINMSDEKIITSLICNGCLNITMQYNRMNTNRKDMRELMNHAILMLTDCIERSTKL